MTTDHSNGYDGVAGEFIAVRSTSGFEIVKAWAESFDKGSSVVDVGAGHGEPLTSALIDAQLAVSAVDASPRMVSEFKKRFPDIPVACEPAQQSEFFGTTFDGVLMVGLIFLLSPSDQSTLITRISSIMNRGGRVLFSAPYQIGKWNDILTKKSSESLGLSTYTRLLNNNGLSVIQRHEDEGGTHYFEAQKQ